ncbi:hypothetical protein L4X63_12335 [Geomonas sp. Red32]|uniref:hypothetical protein n=1 Tax=Geomonas sp. Red32 TaxID=2912856 RepID=UPI00202CB8D0|nr:hypothetical protein [Geomonas sp. Red32]MCM0082377.1 hypothetical protein [Geomonas sp. Red32]
MGFIAAFYTLHENDSDALLAAAKPDIRWIDTAVFMFKKPMEKEIDHFPNFLRDCAVGQEEYAFSGYGFCDLDSLLERSAGWTLFGLGNCDLANKLSEVRATQIAVFDGNAAKLALSKLNGIALEESQVRKYFQENHPPEDEGPGTEAVLAAYEIGKHWLAAVGDKEIGLLILGE